MAFCLTIILFKYLHICSPLWGKIKLMKVEHSRQMANGQLHSIHYGGFRNPSSPLLLCYIEEQLV